MIDRTLVFCFCLYWCRVFIWDWIRRTKMASPMPAPAVTPIGPPPMSIHHQPPTGSIHGPFRLHIILKQGRDLAAKDSCGMQISLALSSMCLFWLLTKQLLAALFHQSKSSAVRFLEFRRYISFWYLGTSDPYVKFKLGNKVIYRSKTVYRDLNPVWEEDFDAQVDDLSVPLHIRVCKATAKSLIIHMIDYFIHFLLSLSTVDLWIDPRCLITIGACKTISWDHRLST